MAPDVIHLGSSRGDAAWTYALLGAGGAVLLGVAPWLARWLADVPVVPARDLLTWIGGYDEPWTWVVRPLVGLALGLLAAVVVLTDEYRLEVGPDAVVVVHGRDRRRLERSAVTGVHRDATTVVIDGNGGRRLFEHKVEASRDEVRRAFAAHSYPYESR